MCLACDGLGIRHDFDPDLLVPDPSMSVWDGAIAPLGPVKEMGKWRRHLFEGVAANLEADPDGPPKGTMLKGPWRDLDEKWRRAWLYGTGDRVIVHRWKSRSKVWSHAEKWVGVANELLAKYRGASGGPVRSQLEPFMRSMTCPDVPGRPAQPRARAVTVGGKSLVELGACRSARSPGSSMRWPADGDSRPARDDSPMPSPLDPVSRTIAEELLKEIRARLTFLIDVGLHYLTLDRGRADALRRRGAADPPGQPGRRGAGGRALYPRRAVDRLASARQRPPAVDPAPARPSWATRWSSSSTMKTRCARPTTWSTSGRGRASRGARSSPRGRSTTWPDRRRA